MLPNPRTVLVIDDNEMIRMLLRTILTEDGYVVVADASNGANGLEQAKKHQPDLIFLDIMLPDQNGIAMIEELREAAPDAIILMVTGKNDADSVKTALEMGARGYIIKPFNIATVHKTVQNAIARALGEDG